MQTDDDAAFCFSSFNSLFLCQMDVDFVVHETTYVLSMGVRMALNLCSDEHSNARNRLEVPSINNMPRN